MNKVIKVKCPICDKSFSYYESEFRPFCSEKCKMVDLGHWLNQTYTIPVVSNPTELVEDFSEEDEQFFREKDEEDS